MERGDEVSRLPVDLYDQAVGRGKVGHGFKVADPVVKLLSEGVGNDGAEQPDGQHDEGDQADDEPPDQVVRTEEVHQVGLAGYPGADYTNIVVTIVIQSGKI